MVTACGAVAMAAAGHVVLGQQWTPPIQKVPHLFVQTEVLGVRGGVTRSLGVGTIEASAGKPGALSLALDLGPPSADHPTSIEIEITQNTISESKLGVTVATTVVVASRSGDVVRVRRDRVAEVDEGRSFFHQAYENPTQGTSVLLTMTPEIREVPELVKPSASAPILFNVSLARITVDGDVPLEDNELRTLEGSPVSYAFRIARAGATPVEVAPGEESAPPDVVTPPAVKDASSATAKDASKRKSKKERERDALARFQQSRDARAESAAPATAAAKDPPGDPEASAAVRDAPESGAAPAPPAADPATSLSSRVALADELELTLLPHRVESGILLVEATLRTRTAGEKATLVRETHALTPRSGFDITIDGGAGMGSYRFQVKASF